MGYESPLTIATVLKGISENTYILPAIQREFVWSTTQIETLFDSLMQGYPFGAFLFWELQGNQNTEYEFYSFLQNYHEKKSKHNPKINITGRDGVKAVLDGQQRMTSIYIGLKGTYAYKLNYKRWDNDDAFPKRKLFLNIVEPEKDGNNKFQFKFLTDAEVVNDKNKFWFEVGKILEMPELSDVNEFIIENFSTESAYTKDQGKFANKALSQLYKIIYTQPSISYYKVQSNELDMILNIFIRVNSGGTVLSYSDLLLSIATAQWKNLDAREEITDFVDTINRIGNGFNVNKDFILKSALVLSDFSNIAFKVDNFNKSNMLTIEQNWQSIKKALTQAFNLVSSYGYSRDTLSSNNAVIPIAYYLKTIGLPNNFEQSTSTTVNRKIIKKWLSMSLVKRLFSGQPDNVITNIREIIKNNGCNDFPLNEIIAKLRGTNKTLIYTNDDIENLLSLQYGKSDTLTILMLLYPSLDYNNRFHMDHMYPKSKFTKKYLSKKNISEDKINEYILHCNDISNLQLLAALPNIEKQDEDFEEWFNNTYESDSDKAQYREINYLPDIEYSYENFGRFLKERKEKLKSELEKILLQENKTDD